MAECKATLSLKYFGVDWEEIQQEVPETNHRHRIGIICAQRNGTHEAAATGCHAEAYQYKVGSMKMQTDLVKAIGFFQ